ncbi:MAG TPA: ribonuclease [Fervidobacterium sp.]|nr:ribonuclease [Fervidobacterium sp.]HOK88146.1 ribonuclease [Fervidobacterium sp.]HOQ38868.1 ribonuclease [Fervidobacterium sp.]HPP18143.1 ribonuclease [Fervidobacterium sp.]HPT54221.1 ribonuclease [Fervidobacterium sp.]
MTKDFENLYKQEFIERFNSLVGKRKIILDILKDYRELNKGKIESLIRNFERPEKEDLKKTNPLVFSFLLDNLFNGRDTIESKITDFERNSISKYVLFEILFWSKPSTYPFPSSKISNYRDFIKEKKSKLNELKLENFLELRALETISEDGFIDEIKKEIIRITPLELEDYLWMRDFVNYLDGVERNSVKSMIHPYVWRVLTCKNFEKPLIIDGNNILMISELKGPEKIDTLLSLVSKLDKIYFPFYVVFDANAKYKFNTKYFKYKRVYYHSPADELILGLAKELNAVVCSRDRYREYSSKIRNIWHELKV